VFEATATAVVSPAASDWSAPFEHAASVSRTAAAGTMERRNMAISRRTVRKGNFSGSI
jgi:hypothetical protein